MARNRTGEQLKRQFHRGLQIQGGYAARHIGIPKQNNKQNNEVQIRQEKNLEER